MTEPSDFAPPTLYERIKRWRTSLIAIALTGAIVLIVGTYIVVTATNAQASILYKGSGITNLPDLLAQAEALHKDSLPAGTVTASTDGAGTTLCFIAVSGERASNVLVCGVTRRPGAVQGGYDTVPVVFTPSATVEGAYDGALVEDAAVTPGGAVAAGTSLRRPDGKTALAANALDLAAEKSTPTIKAGKGVIKGAKADPANTSPLTNRKVTVRTPDGSGIRLALEGAPTVTDADGQVVAPPDGQRFLIITADTPSGTDSTVPDGLTYAVGIGTSTFPVSIDDLTDGVVLLADPTDDVTVETTTDDVSQTVTVQDPDDSSTVGAVTSDAPIVALLDKQLTTTISASDDGIVGVAADTDDGTMKTGAVTTSLTPYLPGTGWADKGNALWLNVTVGGADINCSAEYVFLDFHLDAVTGWEHSAAVADGVQMGAPRAVPDATSSAVTLSWAVPVDTQAVQVSLRPTIHCKGVQAEISGGKPFDYTWTVPEGQAQPFTVTLGSTAAEAEDAADAVEDGTATTDED